MAASQLEEEAKAMPAADEPSSGHHKFAESVQRYSEVPITDQLLAILTKHKVRSRSLLHALQRARSPPCTRSARPATTACVLARAARKPCTSRPASRLQVRMLDLVSEWDDDGNRQITRKEFHKMANFLARERITREESVTLFKTFDEDGAGSIDFGELERLLDTYSELGERPHCHVPHPNATCLFTARDLLHPARLASPWSGSASRAFPCAATQTLLKMDDEANARAHGWMSKDEATATAKARVEELGFEWERFVPLDGWVPREQVEAMAAHRLEELGLDFDQEEREKKVGKHKRKVFAESLRRD